MAMPWMRVVLAFQIIMAGIQELEAHERRRARDIVQRFARDRRLSRRDRDELLRLAKKASRGAGRRAMPGGRKRG
jgi:hypothetical protein